MTKHTPGPWSYKHGDICGPDGRDGDDLVIAAVGQSFGLRSATYSIVRKGPEMEANVRLIVAAPEMLEALKTARKYVGANAGRDAIDAAITKATA